MKTGYKHIDLITTPLPPEHNWNFERTRDPVEAARRSANPTHTTMLELQRTGLNVAVPIVRHDFGYEADRNFALSRIAEQLANAAWYLHGDSEDVMRRRQHLPIFADDSDEDPFRETRSGILYKLRTGLAHAADLSHTLALTNQKGMETGKLRSKLGRQLGNLAVAAESVQIANAPYGMSEFDIQKVVRFYGVDLYRRARERHQDMGGFTPSIAQVAQTVTPVSTEWRKAAPETNEAYELFEQAQRDFGLAA